MLAQITNINSLKLFLTILNIIYIFPLIAQEGIVDYPLQKSDFEHFWESQRLDRYISCIYHDSRGFIWFGTFANGLYKYNAYEFENFNYTYNDTLSLIKNNINKIFLEDSSGDIWISAGYRLHRYNRSSNNFTRFLHNSVDPNSICDGIVSSVVEDQEGNIWIGSYGNKIKQTKGGLTRYERESGKFIRYKSAYEESNAIGISGITSLYVDRTGVLWIGRSCNGVERFMKDSSELGYRFDKFKYISDNPKELLNYGIKDIIEDPLGNIWFGTNGGGILRSSKSKEKIKQYWIHPEKVNKYNFINILSVDSTGELWLGTLGGLAKFDRTNDSIILYENDPLDPYSLTQGPVNSIAHDTEGSSWIITGGRGYSEGINRFDHASEKFFLYQHNPQDPGSLSTNLLLTAVIDKNGILWIGTLNAGINKLNIFKRKFDLYQCKPEVPKGMPQGRINVLFEDSNEVLWIGTHDYGLFRFDRKTNTISNFSFDPENPKSINNNTILTICESPEGILWLGGLGGLKKLNVETMEFTHIVHNPRNPNSLSEDHIMSICRDRSGLLWIATLGGGLNRFDPGSGKFDIFRNDPDDQFCLKTNTLITVYEDSKGTIWIGSFNGLFKYIKGKEGSSERFISYVHDENNTNSLTYNVVRTIIEDNSGNLWIGTEGGGLNKLNLESETFTTYTMEDGLPDNIIWGILLDDKGNLWLSTFNGLSRFNPKTEMFTNYDLSDGLQGMQFTFNTHHKSRSGEMFFAGEKGINYFYPDSIKNNPFIPPIVISDFKLFNKSVPINENSPLKKVISELNEIELNYNENFISFEFAALNYTNSHKNQYKFRMIGLDPDTVYAGTRRFTEYTDMEPGEYKFWVTGSNNDGVWNEEGVSLPIIIHPPFWRSGMAYVLYSLFVIFMVGGFVRWRTLKLRRDKEKLEKQVKERTRKIEEKDFHILEMDRMKTRFFANISHEFRTPLTLILNPLQELISNKSYNIRDREKLSAIHRNGIRLLDLVNQLLDLSKLDSGKLKIELIEEDIFKDLRLIFSSFLSLADKKRIQYYYQVPDKAFFTYFDRTKQETILNNLLFNAFKYTPEDGEISCRVQIINGETEDDNSSIEISVKDSGPGIDKSKLDLIFDRFYQADEQHHIEGGGTGIGLSLTKELVHLIHGEIEVDSDLGGGSCFKVTIPLGKDHLKDSEYIILKQKQNQEYKTIERPTINDKADTELALDKESSKILVVEDNLELRTYIKEQFQNEFHIEEASNGEEGLKEAIRCIPDLIISDIMMPEIDGIEFCRRIKTNERTSHIPVVMLTAKADIESRIEGLVTGADDYIIKPFNIIELKTRVNNLIDQRLQLRKQFASNLSVTPKEITFNSYDVQFINRIIGLVEEHLDDFDFDVNDLQSKASMSRTQLYRKLFALTGLSPSKFIRNLRLKRAAKLFQQKSRNVTEVAFEVGFNNLSYFTKSFKEQYGITPSDYCKQFS